MENILFEISYKIDPERKDEYFEIVSELTDLFKMDGVLEYRVFEDSKDEDAYTEQILFENEDTFDTFEDNQPEESEKLISRLFDDIVVPGSVKYSTKKLI